MIDLEKFKPKSEEFEVIKNIVLALKAENNPEYFSDDGNIRLKPIYEALNGEISYDDIRISLLFL